MPFRDVAPPRGPNVNFPSAGASAPQPSLQGRAMKNLLEVLRMKEEEIVRLRKEIEALKITARILSDDPAQNETRTQYRQLLKMP
jgi:hypothetical protein